MSGRNATHAMRSEGRGGEGMNHLPVRLAQVGVRRGGVEAEDLARRLAERRARLHLELDGGRSGGQPSHRDNTIGILGACRQRSSGLKPSRCRALAGCGGSSKTAREATAKYSDGAAARSVASPPSSRRRRRPRRGGRAPPNRRRRSRGRRATRGTRRAARGRAGACVRGWG